MKGPAITAADLKGNRGGIEHISAPVFFGAKDGPAPPQRGSAPAPAGGATKGVAVMAFGKHKGRPMSEVQETDPGYWSWAVREVGGFAAKARQAGLLDEDDL